MTGGNGNPAAALAVVGTSHRRADLSLRERLHLGQREATELAAKLARGGEAAVLSTCNRTEIYIVGEDAVTARKKARAELSALVGLDAADLAPRLDELEGEEAALHLFRVSAGLESLLPGEGQILGQVRQAYESALEAGTTGPILNRLFAQALHAGKRVRAETGLGTLPASIPAAAVEVAEQTLGDLAGRRVLVLGAGKMAALAVSNFVARGAEKVFVANHRFERAEELARRLGGEAVAFERLREELVRADVVLAATRCPRLVLFAGDVAPGLGRRAGRPILFLDIAVPRDVDPAVGNLEGCSLYDLDALGEALGAPIAERRAELTASEAIVAEEAAQFSGWLRSLQALPVIKALRDRAEAIRREELARNRGGLGALSQGEREAVETLTAQIVNKLLHEPTVRMKAAAAEERGRPYAGALRELFALDEERA
ncbi:MAG: glutamyl-tRNA reductase [Actinomycetota bacterium]|nr:glutamyl-tRNA reductase [Actinomycetota bacterium]